VPGKGEIMRRWTNKIKNKQYGQAMVEFALTLPIFLLAVIGVIELSRFFLVYSSVYTASREAARYGSSVGDDGNIHYMDCDGIRQVAQDTGFFGGVNTTNVNVYYEAKPGDTPVACPSDVPLGYRLVVEAQADYSPLIAGFVLPDGITVSATNGRTIMKEVEVLATPLPIPVCGDDIQFVSTALNNPATNQKERLYIDIKNLSSHSTYELISVTDISWDNTKPPARYLQSVTWGGRTIWVKPTPANVEPPINILTFSSQVNRNLIPGSTTRLIYVFDKNVPETIMKFKINFQHINRQFPPCQLKIGY
jgi:Flp pilus assembly protein TadG